MRQVTFQTLKSSLAPAAWHTEAMDMSLLFVMGLFFLLHGVMSCRLKLWNLYTSVAVTFALVSTSVALMQ